ncbi:putative transporter [Yarrowia sp. C11]|nr:putative transporter [Yarrowia sp. C11]
MSKESFHEESFSENTDNNSLEGQPLYPAPMSDEEIQNEINNLAEKYGVNQRRLMMKVDLCVIPTICLLYILAFLDRVNISNANVYGMSKDLGLKGNHFNVALAIFFVPYVVAEIPSNWLMKKTSPHVWLPGCMVLFGCTLLGQGFVKNYGQILATRFLLGLFEAGMFPGCFYLISMWYRREESQKRYSFFFSSTCLAGAFGGLIAAGIHNLDGHRGIEAWRWIFIIEGACTAFIAMLMYFAISDFPEDAKFLSENERQFMKEKLAVGTVGGSEYDRGMSLKDLKFVFTDWKIWMSGMMYFGLVVPAYGYAYFGTAIVKTLGYSEIKTQFYSVPPWVAAFGLSMGAAIFSDRFRHRFLFAIGSCIVCVAGFGLIMGEHHKIGTRYGALFMICAGAYTCMPMIVCWTQMNFSGHHRRAIASGWQIGFGNIAGFISTFVFKTEDAPFYMTGLGCCIAFTALSGILAVVYYFGLRAANKKKQSPEYAVQFSQWSEDKQRMAGELHPSIFYTY